MSHDFGAEALLMAMRAALLGDSNARVFDDTYRREQD